MFDVRWLRGLRLPWITTGLAQANQVWRKGCKRCESCKCPAPAPAPEPAAAVMGFDYSHGRPPPSDPQYIPVVSFRESRPARCGAMPGASPHPRSPSAAPPRPAPSLSETRCTPIGCPPCARAGDAVVRVDEGPQPACTRHHRPTLHTKATPHTRPWTATTRGTPSCSTQRR
jgi:hypothetical protein